MSRLTKLVTGELAILLFGLFVSFSRRLTVSPHVISTIKSVK